MKPTLVKDCTHRPKGHDLRIHGYYFGSNQRCRACNAHLQTTQGRQDH